MLTATNIHYEISDRDRGIAHGVIGVIHSSRSGTSPSPMPENEPFRTVSPDRRSRATVANRDPPVKWKSS
jgi:hypothetical protein